MRRKAEKGGGGVGGKRGREVVSCLHLPPWQMNPFVSTRRVIRCVAGGQCAEGLNLTESDKKRGGGCKSRALHSLIRLSTHARPAMADLRGEKLPLADGSPFESTIFRASLVELQRVRDVYSMESNASEHIDLGDRGIKVSTQITDCAH